MQYQQDDLMILFYLQRYGFLSIKQAIKCTDLNRHRDSISRRLLLMQRASLIDSFGNIRYGFTKAPKIYYIMQKGFDLLLENRIPSEMLGKFKLRNKTKWSPVFEHRLNVVDIFLSLEIALKKREELELVKLFMDYNRLENGQCETTDFINSERVPENKIVPDGAFIIKSHNTGNTALFFVEMDKGTETILSRLTPNDRTNTLYNRLNKYDKYLQGGNFSDKYSEWGEFAVFRLLFITDKPARVNNIREKTSTLPEDLHQFYFFNNLENVKEDFLNETWKSRDIEDEKGYRVI